ncbi:MAG: DUF1178 family protein [Allosphingosinicella sp.]|uniref:DUF1178 family protein n=1 Tax=Allosphingosinicella sp. TaxID=2823234 RepID=UPI00395E97A7
MIVFDLKCPSDHVFEAWFGSSGDYEAQKARGLVSCPICGAGEVDKAVMAPNVAPKGNAGGYFSSDPAEVKRMLATLAAEQKKVVDSSEYVGDRFADEARAIHLGDSAARSIYGRATRAQTESLLDEGIPVAPLPFPVAPPGEEN